MTESERPSDDRGKIVQNAIFDTSAKAHGGKKKADLTSWEEILGVVRLTARLAAFGCVRVWGGYEEF
jgi:hypothetical protein